MSSIDIFDKQQSTTAASAMAALTPQPANCAHCLLNPLDLLLGTAVGTSMSKPPWHATATCAGPSTAKEHTTAQTQQHICVENPTRQPVPHVHSSQSRSLSKSILPLLSLCTYLRMTPCCISLPVTPAQIVHPVKASDALLNFNTAPNACQAPLEAGPSSLQVPNTTISFSRPDQTQTLIHEHSTPGLAVQHSPC
jgi:hypothetical protein